MLGRLSFVRHLGAVGSVVLLSAVVASGEMGSRYPERFDSWQSVLRPADERGVRIVDTFDQDFGTYDRHGPERFIRQDAGIPSDVEASSETAPDTLDQNLFGDVFRFRVGDRDILVTGQHRYRFAYTLPGAPRHDDTFSVDVLAPDGPEIGRFELIVTGFVFDDLRCEYGTVAATEPCTWLDERDGFYRTVIEPLDADHGVNVTGQVVGVVPAIEVAPPPLPEPRRDHRRPLAAAVGGLGLLGVFAVYRWNRRQGRNEVAAGGAADAAYATSLPDGAAAAGRIELVPDDELAELATIEFVPPKGLAPWQGHVLLTEHVGNAGVEAWLSGLVADEVIELHEPDAGLVIASGPKRGELTEPDASLLDGLMQGRDRYVTGTYDEKFAKAWTAIERSLEQRSTAAGWWRRGSFGAAGGRGPLAILAITMIPLLVMMAVTREAPIGLVGKWYGALVVGVAIPLIVAAIAYLPLRAVRTPIGSALSLRVESFRRFLHDSEGKHVDWAWSNDLLREYSGWAVALGEADAWSDALEQSNVPAPVRASTMGPIIVRRRSSTLGKSRAAPPAKSSPGGGRGAGGASRGSW